MKKRKHTYNGVEFDSNEEIEFYLWCEEAYEAGIITHFTYQPQAFILSERASVYEIKKLKTKKKFVDKFLFHPHKYTPDFEIVAKEIKALTKTSMFYYVDVKGGFSIYNNHREFSINQKWVYDKFGHYINKVEPLKFFGKTWVPELARYTKTRKDLKKCYIGYNTIEDIKNDTKQI